MTRRLSQLLDSHVVDADGRALGRVHDVVAVQDGPIELPFGALLRVDTLRVGGNGLATRLGYATGEVKGPWPLKAFFDRLLRHGLEIPWGMVEAWEDHELRLRPEWSAAATRR